jgi:carbon monoxide dehydrogenase subunit G
MKLEQSFEVSAPVDVVWEALVDVERVAPCLPGATVSGRNDDGSYDGTFKVKIGPTSASYAGKLKMEQVDESVHTATMEAQGTDKRGQGGAKATIVSSLSETGSGSTRVDVSTDYHITGRLARFGRGGMIEDISNRLLGEFAKCLQTNLAGRTGEAAPDTPQGAGAQGPEAQGADASAEEPPVPATGEPATDEVQAGAIAAAEATAGTPTEAGGEAGATSASDETGGEAGPASASGKAGADGGSASASGEAGADEGSASASGAAAAEQVAAAGEAAQQAAASGERVPGGAATAPGGPAAEEQPAPSSPPPIEPQSESPHVHGHSLMATALWGQAKRNPAQAIALVVGFLLALRVFRRRS